MLRIKHGTASIAADTLEFSGILPPPRPSLPVVGEQGDILYRAVRAKSVLNTPEATGMGYWSLNPYVGCALGCAYCYARYAHRYVMERATAADGTDAQLVSESHSMPPWLAFERRVMVKENAATVLRNALRHGGEKHLGLVRGESLVIGTATDPYQPAERTFRITRGVLEVLADHPGLRISIISKSPLVTRDIDLLRRIARHSRIVVHLSLISPDRELARKLEPRAPTPEARLRAITRLRDAGIDAGIFCMPVLPGITDNPESLELLVRKVAAAGATHLVSGSLRLQSAARERYLPFIASEFPHLAERYRRTFSHSYQLSTRYLNGLKAFMHALCKRYGIPETSRDEEEDGEDQSDPVQQLDLFDAPE
jgi:DNA repair photolyase